MSNNGEKKNVNYVGNAYSKFRPTYSYEIYSLIYETHNANQGEYNLAIDVGCGTGQVTTILAEKFKQVHGIDTLEEQINNAIRRSNITYKVGPAENLSQFADNSVDLITVGTAFHWFDHEKFLQEAKRVLKKDGKGTLAIFGYYYPRIKNEPEADNLLKGFTKDVYDPVANENIRYIKNMYRDIKYPFKNQVWYITPTSEDVTRISRPTRGPLMEASMTMENFKHYMKTSSAYSNYIEENKDKDDPADKLVRDLMETMNITDYNHVIQLEWPTVLVLLN
ncbi:S-adenosyl-L-methionine-dependent methyltransferase [Mycotypha africana]|uniref:S-adenosyl-L-methionine-dependent methyltransferase n=1 Tax=Mycotypha africana TaxID=64632 RepID=UPI00230145FF|nr:S-adenosyl-L-methionine-dependent methyltransferase [Mycotypha africana]KAI8979434.1 S-adenosyl-L-methionine-dependent methyltransferase [Mycotypha africana]